MSVSEAAFSQAPIEPSVSSRIPLPPRTFDCPSCGGTVVLRAIGRAVTAICPNCSSVIDVNNENFRIVETAQSSTWPTLLAMGARGKLDGIFWEIIGYTRKTDATGAYPWDEYLLFNPYYGFRFLSHEAGHWTLSHVIKKNLSVRRSDTRIAFEGREYKIFLRGASVVHHVQGEFYWRVKVGERWATAEYICPPYLLSVEENDSEINFSLGRYVSRTEIIEAFKSEGFLPLPSGVGANQPSPFEGRNGRLWKQAIGAVIAACLVHFFFFAGSNNRAVFQETINVQATSKGIPVTTKPFVLRYGGIVEVTGYAPVRNDWVELSLTLVEEGTGTEHTSVMPIEYYFGSDSDGPWSEGRQVEETYFSGVSKGTYRLMVDADGGALSLGSSQSVRLTVVDGVVDSTNLLAALALLLIVPVIQLWRQIAFEGRRWGGSDFNPDGSQGDDDD
ncbi:hypothetical protein ANOBCDAF_00434 [Pleomorphomonas sp. T1.2MG-36]|uniref:DUF4178 domain-containing protein n=1 Tax=Pleomorphomonas sp. T1.2MG-36 TaxID=3041167 RepID=UPI00247745D5|nr:DUF4178 domain-containing protein [Pleomorphomonas sp. T1.2MG-36]CAI9400187.1 hypothetical protein ANOBCDAF_00434 [Pleomorphomonas sp. T1.2MG-36]